ncbi:glycosyltransferase family A protein [Sphingobium sp.]|uniref:glycosyltransferase family A protein n=1 Tax=Sphingobium sp. TaxID=1912891 RepID=UPI002C046D66|nr:glycosyltransferase family A protein [Sphingobium sp.]HUD90658.1 glycosyltransferase family A protein [Sphingobium sp.]
MNAHAGPVGTDLSVAVVVASLGRPDLVSQIRSQIENQTHRPDILLFSVVDDADLPADFVESNTVKVVKARRGLCAQRNAALDVLGEAHDLIVFYDDDFVPSRFSVERIKRFFSAHPEVVGATGNVIADGINTKGISRVEAEEILRLHEEKDFSPNCIVMGLTGLYGCNMVYRAASLKGNRFDERLKLYAWQEDVDFAASLRSRGRIVKTFAFAGVHLGVKVGRTPGVRLGYSQVINPSYLASKGTMTPVRAARLILRNIIANHARCFRPEPWVDRIGRAKGNWIGLGDLLRGRLTPERIESL